MKRKAERANNKNKLFQLRHIIGDNWRGVTGLNVILSTSIEFVYAYDTPQSIGKLNRLNIAPIQKVSRSKESQGVLDLRRGETSFIGTSIIPA